jgi:regulation of enolase protein 1 (concanavalin A-like superfamily)
MFQHSGRLLSSVIALGTTTAIVLAGDGATPRDLPGWGRVYDPSRDCEVSLDADHNRLRITVPGTPHTLSVENSSLPMSAPRVVHHVRADFTAEVRVLGRLAPGQSKTTHYDPFHGAGLIVWQDAANYLRLERAVGFINGRSHPYLNYELREGGRLAMSLGITIEDRSLFLRLRRQGPAFSAWYSRDGRRWVRLANVNATFNDQLDVGVVAVNSSARTLSAELERLNITDPYGSKARDTANDDDPEKRSAPLRGLNDTPCDHCATTGRPARPDEVSREPSQAAVNVRAGLRAIALGSSSTNSFGSADTCSSRPHKGHSLG